MTGVITFLCCSDTRRYVTAAGSICPVAPAARVRNGKCYLSGITPDGENGEERGIQTTKCDSAIANVCEGSSRPRYSVCFDVIIAHGRRRGFHSGRPNLGNDPRKSIFDPRRLYLTMIKNNGHILFTLLLNLIKCCRER